MKNHNILSFHFFAISFVLLGIFLCLLLSFNLHTKKRTTSLWNNIHLTNDIWLRTFRFIWWAIGKALVYTLNSENNTPSSKHDDSSFLFRSHVSLPINFGQIHVTTSIKPALWTLRTTNILENLKYTQFEWEWVSSKSKLFEEIQAKMVTLQRRAFIDSKKLILDE